MISENHRKEMASRAFVSAIIAKAGCTMATPNLDYGIDLGVTQVKERPDFPDRLRLVEGYTFKIQIKSTSDLDIDEGVIRYDLEAKNYRDLIDASSNVPRLLVLVHLHEDENERVKVTDEAIMLKTCAYYANLAGNENRTSTSTVRIKIPVRQRFTHQFISDFFETLEQGGM